MHGVLFGLMSTRARWLSQREAVLSQNIANADTPGYQPIDLKARSFKELLLRRTGPDRSIQLVATRPTHLAGATPSTPQAKSSEVDGFETAPTGNAVVLDEQLRKLAETQLDFETITNLYRRQVGLLKTALGSQQS
jgi:flagellar basal-body rod protein FlgB